MLIFSAICVKCRLALAQTPPLTEPSTFMSVEEQGTDITTAPTAPQESAQAEVRSSSDDEVNNLASFY